MYFSKVHPAALATQALNDIPLVNGVRAVDTTLLLELSLVDSPLLCEFSLMDSIFPQAQVLKNTYKLCGSRGFTFVEMVSLLSI